MGMDRAQLAQMWAEGTSASHVPPAQAATRLCPIPYRGQPNGRADLRGGRTKVR